MLRGSSDKLLVTKTNLDIHCCERIVDIREAPLMGVIWHVKNKETCSFEENSEKRCKDDEECFLEDQKSPLLATMPQ